MVDYSSHKAQPSPGQLWKNARTRKVLFICFEDDRLGGIWSDGTKMRNEELMNLEDGKDGWKCVYIPGGNDGTDRTEYHSYEYRSL